MTRLRKQAYKVGWLTALSIEFAAASAMLESRHDPPWNYQYDPQSRNQYIFGSINGHNIVITSLPDGVYGTTSATRVAHDFHRDFPDLQYRFTVGIAGGAPSAKNDVRLGDVVVSRPMGSSPGVIQYDLGKALEDGVFIPNGNLPKPPENILRALPLVRQWPEKMLSAAVFQLLGDVFKWDINERFRPPPVDDNLFVSNYHHKGKESDPCGSSCDPSSYVDRQPRDSWLDIKQKFGVPLEYGRVRWGHDDNDINIRTPLPRIHFGIIASGNTLMRDGEARKKIQAKTGALCFEMEAAGIMDAWPCLVVRGICDYSDSHKNKTWQPYAAGTAAAFTKFLLLSIPHKYERIPPPRSLGSIQPDSNRALTEEKSLGLPISDKNGDRISPGYGYIANPQNTYQHNHHNFGRPSYNNENHFPHQSPHGYAYPSGSSQPHTYNRDRGSEPLTNEVITTSGTTVRQWGNTNTNGGSVYNGDQRFSAEELDFGSSGKGNTFNGSQDFNAKGTIKF